MAKLRDASPPPPAPDGREQFLSAWAERVRRIEPERSEESAASIARSLWRQREKRRSS